MWLIVLLVCPSVRSAQCECQRYGLGGSDLLTCVFAESKLMTSLSQPGTLFPARLCLFVLSPWEMWAEEDHSVCVRVSMMACWNNNSSGGEQGVARDINLFLRCCFAII